MTTDAGRPVGDNQNSLTVGARGPVVFEDALHQAEEVAGLAVIIPYSPMLQPHTASTAKGENHAAAKSHQDYFGRAHRCNQ